MIHLDRREFLLTSAVSAGGLFSLCQHLQAEGQRDAALRAKSADSLRITEIETHEILLPYHDFNARDLFRYHGLGAQLRTIHIVKTNQEGLEGYGECWGSGWPREEVASYVGSCPFDWIGDTNTFPINMAMYDLMGKYLGLPVWKLIGQKHRDRVPVSAWTVSRTPEQMAEEVRHAAQQGYWWLKYHVDEIQNVVDQTAAMQEAAPAGFKVLYDFNANSTFEAVAPIIKKLEQFPVAGRIEDPIVASDPDGWRRIKELSSLPILVHHGPLEFMVKGIVDGFMAGHAPIGKAIHQAEVAEATNTPIMLQQAGGTINQAYLAHEAAVFKMATIDHVNLARLWKDDITNETMQIDNGYVEVPKGPGLGVTINREKLKKYESAKRPQYEPFLVRIRYEGGPTIYTRHNPDKPGSNDSMRFLKRLLGEPIPGPAPAYDNPVISDIWDDQASADFQRLWKATENGYVVEG